MTGGPPRPYSADAELAESGARRISYSQRSMPLLEALAARFRADRPFDGMTVAACLHVTAETAVLARTLRAGGAQVALAASNPLSTQDDIAAALAASDGVAVFARAGVDRRTYYEHIALALGAAGAAGPDLVIDDGGDLMNILHTERADVLDRVRGGCEGTTLPALVLDGQLLLIGRTSIERPGCFQDQGSRYRGGRAGSSPGKRDEPPSVSSPESVRHQRA